MTVFKIISTDVKRNVYRNEKSCILNSNWRMGCWKIGTFRNTNIPILDYSNKKTDVGMFHLLFYRNVYKNEQTINGLNSQFINNINN